LGLCGTFGQGVDLFYTFMKQEKLTTAKMPGETEQQYIAWLFYTEIGSIRKLLQQWEMLWQGIGKTSAELEEWRKKLGKPVARRNIEQWSVKYQWVKRTELKLTEDLEGLREKTKKIAGEKKHKILEIFETIVNKVRKELKAREGLTIDELKKVWEMAQVELGKPTTKATLEEEQRPLTPEERERRKLIDEALKPIVTNPKFYTDPSSLLAELKNKKLTKQKK